MFDSITKKPITLEKHRVKHSCRNLCICNFLIQPRSVTLSFKIPSTGSNLTITPEEDAMSAACWNLGVSDSSFQRWNVALSSRIVAASHSSAITSEEHGMITACWSLGVSHSSLQLWNVALSRRILSTSHSATVTSDKHSMTITCRNHWKRPGRLTRAKTAWFFEPNGLIVHLVHLASNWTQFAAGPGFRGPVYWYYVNPAPWHHYRS
jgi:hypothetical protein